MIKTDAPLIVHQGVDTLRIAHIIKNEDNYTKYLEILHLLDNKKDEAILANSNYEYEHGILFDFYSFGKFFIRPKGQGRYKYVIYNQDIEIFFSTVKFGSNDFNTPQIVVDFRAKYLTIVGHLEAYNLVKIMLTKLLSTQQNKTFEDIFSTKIMRIDLATDIANIKYQPLDKYRFQTQFKNIGHFEFKEYISFNRLTGFTFGKGNYMFRIYDKRLELNNNSSKLYLATVWAENGYDSINKPPVWRHEVQLRRQYIKAFIPIGLNDEVSYFFEKLGNLWSFAFAKVTYVELSDFKVLKLINDDMSPDAVRKMFYREKKNNPSQFWELASTWNGKVYEYPKLYKSIKIIDYKVSKRFLKSFLSTAYKSDFGNPMSAIKVFDLVSDELLEKDGITLHDYSQMKLLGSFIDNSQTIRDYGLVVDYDFLNASAVLYKELQKRLMNLENESFNKLEYRLARLFNTDVLTLRENIDYFINLDNEKLREENFELGFVI